MPEVGLGEKADFVVVVEHHATMAGDAEIFQQHVTREDIRRRQLLDGQAVVFQRFAYLGVVGVVQVEVEWGHAPFGPTVADQHGVAFHFDGTRRHFQQLGQAVGLELAQGETEVGELLGIGHAPYPVDAFHQAVLFDHRGAVDVFRRRETVLDDLEHGIEARQGKHAHDHAPHAGGHDELVVGGRQVVDQCTVELRLTVLIETDGGVQLGDVLARQDALEKTDELRRHGDIDHEIGTGEREDDRHVSFIGNQRIDLDALAFTVQQRNDQRPLLVAGVDPPYQVGAFIAVEHRGKQLDLEVRVLADPIRQVFAQLGFEAAQVGGKVRIGFAEAVVGENLREHFRNLAPRRIDARLRRACPAQAGPGGVDKHAAVADQVMAEQAAKNRVVPGLGQLIVEAQVDQADVGVFHQGPDVDVQ